MGCSHSTEFVVQDTIPGQDTLAFITFQRLHLDTRDINTFYKVFRDIDATDSNIIRVDEFLAYFRLEKTQLHLKLFGVTDTEHHGYLTFSEMVCLVWDFLSRDATSLGSFVFYLFDEKRVNYLERKEITELITAIDQLNLSRRRKGVEHMVDNICHICGEIIDVIKFDNYYKQNPQICGPIVGLQLSLQRKMMGSFFWHRMEHLRSKNLEQIEPRYVHGLLEEMKLIRENKIREEHVRDKYQEHAKNVLDHSVGDLSSLMKVITEKDLPKRKRLRRSTMWVPPVIVYEKPNNYPKKALSFPNRKSSKIAPKVIRVSHTKKMVTFQDTKDKNDTEKHYVNEKHIDEFEDHQYNINLPHPRSRNRYKRHPNHKYDMEEIDDEQDITTYPSLDDKDSLRTQEEKMRGSILGIATVVDL